MAQLFSIQAVNQEEEEPDYGGKLRWDSKRNGFIPWEVNQLDLLDELLAEFKDLFEEPKALPPPRPLDHTINLKPNSKPVNICSYRYPPKQKAKIECMIKEMLHVYYQTQHQPHMLPLRS